MASSSRVLASFLANFGEFYQVFCKFLAFLASFDEFLTSSGEFSASIVEKNSSKKFTFANTYNLERVGYFFPKNWNVIQNFQFFIMSLFSFLLLFFYYFTLWWGPLVGEVPVHMHMLHMPKSGPHCVSTNSEQYVTNYI